MSYTHVPELASVYSSPSDGAGWKINSHDQKKKVGWEVKSGEGLT